MTTLLLYPLAASAGPGGVTLIAPSGSISAETTPSTIAFSWNANTDSTYYAVKVMDSTGKQTLFRKWYTAASVGCSSGSGTCSVTPTSTFEAGNYTWSIRTYGATGMGATTTGSFALSKAASSPGLPSGSTTKTTPTYRWSAITSATYYQLRVTTSSGSTIYQKWHSAASANCSGSIGSCSVKPSTVLTNGSSYLWYVKPWPTSLGAESSAIAFTIGTAVTPISLTSPTGSITDTTPTYIWTASSTATQYRLRVAKTGSGQEFISQWYTAAEVGCSSGTGSCSVTPTVDIGEGSFTWEVTTSPDYDKQTLTFSTAPTALETPTPTSPSGATSSTAPTFSWGAVSSATHYKLKVTASTGSIVLNSSLTASQSNCSAGTGTCSFTPSLSLPDGASSWTVTAFNTSYSLSSSESSALAFTVTAPVVTPGVPTPTSPSGTIGTTTPTYSWTATENTTHYKLTVTGSSGTVISTQYSASTLGCSSGTGTCSITPTTTLTDGDYQWTLQGVNETNSETGAVSSAVSFTVLIGSTTATLTAPTGTISETAPTYTWSAISGATNYRLMIEQESNGALLLREWYTADEAGCSSGTGSCSVTPAVTLDYDQTINWSIYVLPDKQTGSTTFKVTRGDLTTPSIVSPNSTTESTTQLPSFSWTAVADATHYYITIINSEGTTTTVGKLSANAANCSSGTGNCSITPSTKLPTGQGSWSIYALDETNVRVSTTATTTFTIATSATGPGLVNLITPTGTETTKTPLFSWSPDVNSTHYKLVITDASSVEVVNYTMLSSTANCGNGLVTCSITLTQELADGTYGWTIQTVNNTTGTMGSQTASQAFTISTGDEDGGSTGNFALSPTGTVTTVTPTFTWTAITDSTNYRIKIQEQTSGSALLRQSFTASEAGCSSSTDCSATPEITLGSGSYVWEVQAFPSGVKDSLSFTVQGTSIVLSSDSIDENSATPVQIGTLSIYEIADQSTDSSQTYTLGSENHEAYFQIVNGSQLWINSSYIPNYEDKSTLTVSVTSSSGLTGTLTINVNDINEAPTEITLTGGGVAENDDTTSALTVGTLSAVDEDIETANLSHTFAVTGGEDQAHFQITDTSLQFVAGTSLNVDTKPTYSVEVTVTDGGGLTYAQTLTVTITTSNYAPTDLTLSVTSIDENPETGVVDLTIGTLTATDQDTDDTHTFTVIGGADQALFTVNGSNLMLLQGTTFDYETMTTTSVEVQIRATDAGGKSFDKTLTLDINDINDAPTDITLSAESVEITPPSPATLTAAAEVGTLTATDQDTGNTHTFAVTGGSDSALFEVSGEILQVKSGSELTTGSTLVVEVTVTDNGSLTYTKSLSITVTEVNVAPTDIGLSSSVLPFMDRPTSMSVGVLTTTDLNAADTFTYTLTDDQNGAFAIEDDQLMVVDSDGSVFGVFSLEITTTDSGGLTYSETFSVSIGGFSVEDIPESNASVSAMQAAAKATYAAIYKNLFESAAGGTVVVSESDFENMIIGKVGQQFTSGGTFTYSLTDVIKQFNLEITGSLITATMEIGVIDAIHARLPSSVQTAANSLFDTLTPYASDYTAGVRFRVVPTVSGTSISFDSASSYVDVLHEDSLLTPNLTFTLSELISGYNGIISDMATDSLSFFLGGGSTPPHNFLVDTLGDTPEVWTHYNDNIALELGSTDFTTGQTIPTSQNFSYYFPGLISSIAIADGSVTLTR
ncbi:MAG: cadherin repeat domain-containing protein [Magnetococcales bacterium]|nr:cadherin repeat domain-containing protein [Magnetococcales bacterium]